jgi:hypothetical protein
LSIPYAAVIAAAPYAGQALVPNRAEIAVTIRVLVASRGTGGEAGERRTRAARSRCEADATDIGPFLSSRPPSPEEHEEDRGQRHLVEAAFAVGSVPVAMCGEERSCPVVKIGRPSMDRGHAGVWVRRTTQAHAMCRGRWAIATGPRRWHAVPARAEGNEVPCAFLYVDLPPSRSDSSVDGAQRCFDDGWDSWRSAWAPR